MSLQTLRPPLQLEGRGSLVQDQGDLLGNVENELLHPLAMDLHGEVTGKDPSSSVMRRIVAPTEVVEEVRVEVGKWIARVVLVVVETMLDGVHGITTDLLGEE